MPCYDIQRMVGSKLLWFRPGSIELRLSLFGSMAFVELEIAMNRLTKNSSPALTYTSILYLRVQLVRKPAPANTDSPDAPKQLIVECQEQLSRIRNAQDKLQTAKVNRMGINAELHQATNENYQLLVQIAREIRTMVKGDSQHPTYLKIFPKSPSEAANPNQGYAQHFTYAVRVKNKIASDPTYDTVLNYVPQLEENLKQIQELLSRREVLFTEENDASVELSTVTREAQAFYNHAYIRLLMVYNSNTKIVDPCFYRLPHSKKKASNKKASADDDDLDLNDDDTDEDEDIVDDHP